MTCIRAYDVIVIRLRYVSSKNVFKFVTAGNFRHLLYIFYSAIYFTMRMSVVVSNCPYWERSSLHYVIYDRLCDISVTQFPYLMFTSTVMPKEPAWNSSLKTIKRQNEREMLLLFNASSVRHKSLC